MKILQLFFRVPFPALDGGAIAMYNMAKGFKDQGVDLTILSYNTTKHHVEVNELPKAYTDLGKWHFAEVDNTIKPFGAFLNLFSNKSYHTSRFETPKVEKLLKELLKKNEFDIIHFEGLFTGIYVDLVKKLAPKAKTVLRAHNVEYRIWERMTEEAVFPKKLYLKLLTKRLREVEVNLIPKFDAIVPITPVDEQFFEGIGAKKQFVSPTGFDLPVQKKVAKEPYSVYHLGSMDWQPNQEAIVWFMEKVWFLVKKAVPKATFYLAGRNMSSNYQAFSRVPGVDVVGEVPDAAAFIADKMVSVIPIKSGSGLRIKIIEGLASGKAIVSTTIGAEGVAYEDGVSLDIADKPEDFAQKVIALLKTPQLVEERGLKAKQLAEKKYSNFALVGDLIAFYQSLLTK